MAPCPSQAAPQQVLRPGEGPQWHLPPGAQGDAVLMAPADGSSTLGLPRAAGSEGNDTRGMKPRRKSEEGVAPQNQPDPTPCVFSQ